MVGPLTRQRIVQVFRIRGLSLRPEALQRLEQVANSYDDPLGWVKLALDEIRKKVLDTRCIEAAHVEAAAHAIDEYRTGASPTAIAIEVIDAPQVPKLVFDVARHSFSSSLVGAPSLHGTVDDQRDVEATRLQFIRQRLMRQDLFKAPVLDYHVTDRDYLRLTEIEALSRGSVEQCILGVLCEPIEGVYHIEDGSGMVPLDFSQASTSIGMYTLGCVVLAEGELTPEGTFLAKVIAMPPLEKREDTLVALDGVNFFGGESSSKANDDREELLKASKDAMLVALSDLWLDRADTLSHLQTILQGYESVAEQARKRGGNQTVAGAMLFVLCGNFTSRAASEEDLRTTAQGFQGLADVIASCPLLAAEAHFVLVPGPRDAVLGPVDVMPRAPLPKILTAAVARQAQHLHCATSPVRIKFFGREVVVLRNDTLAHMRRNAVLANEGDGDGSSAVRARLNPSGPRISWLMRVWKPRAPSPADQNASGAGTRPSHPANGVSCPLDAGPRPAPPVCSRRDPPRRQHRALRSPAQRMRGLQPRTLRPRHLVHGVSPHDQSGGVQQPVVNRRHLGPTNHGDDDGDGAYRRTPIILWPARPGRVAASDTTRLADRSRERGPSPGRALRIPRCGRPPLREGSKQFSGAGRTGPGGAARDGSMTGLEALDHERLAK